MPGSLAKTLLAISALLGSVAGTGAQGADPRLEAYLAWADEHFDPAAGMLAVDFRSPGYHTTVPDGTRSHPTRPSLDYALALLERHAPGDAERAAQILPAVLRLQDTDPFSSTYGIWPWLLEEPLAQMAPPDRNWADFCGAKIAQMLHDHAGLLPPAVVASMRESLRLATREIRQRNVGPEYTNICVMGAGVCVAAGEILGDADLLRYGRERFQRMVAHTDRHGGFNEYNSPTYTTVVLFECERTLHLVADPASRQAAETLRRVAWQTIADSFHPGTQQWAGPQSRAYGDYTAGSLLRYLGEQSGHPLVAHPKAGDPDDASRYEVLFHLPCPDALRPRLAALPSDPLELRRMFVQGDSPDQSIVGTTWFTADACLGSVNQGDFWTQRRPLLAYWRTAADPAVVLRMRFLHDGRDFASMGLRTEQQGPRAVTSVYPLQKKGDWHPSLDRPATGLFSASDFRVRYELQGVGATVDDLGQGRFALRAGDWRAVIHTLPGRFAGTQVVWEVNTDRDWAVVDGVCYTGPARDFDFRAPPETVLAAAVELQPTRDALSASPVMNDQVGGEKEICWGVVTPPIVVAIQEDE